MHRGEGEGYEKGKLTGFLLQLFPLISSVWISASSPCHDDLGVFLSRQPFFMGKKDLWGRRKGQERRGERAFVALGWRHDRLAELVAPGRPPGARWSWGTGGFLFDTGDQNFPFLPVQPLIWTYANLWSNYSVANPKEITKL